MEQNNIVIFSADKSIRETIYEILKYDILSGELAPNERILEKAVAEKYNISRTPIREALHKLEEDGLVTYTRSKGVVVSKLSETYIREIYVIRQSLEKLVLENAIQHVKMADIRKLDTILDQIEQHDQMGDIKTATQYSRKFHVYFYEMSQLPRVQTLITSLDEYMDRFSFMILLDENQRRQSDQEHHQMVDALREKDLEQLLTVSRQHLQSACDQCIKGYNERFNIEQIKKNDE